MDLSAHEGEIPIPISSAYVGGQGHGGHHNSFIHHHDPSSNGPAPPIAPPPLPLISIPAPARYRECLKNHAASIGGNATDGCGEFMPSGEEGSLEALKCSACGCHRNFHRKEIDGEQHPSSCDCFHHMRGARKLVGAHKGVLISSASDVQYGYHQRPTPHNMIMPIGAAGVQTSESDEMEGVGVGYPRPPMLKKRFRTKFSVDQKEKMLAFAEKAGWKLQKLDETAVQQFCLEIGVKRRVLKVWMHNNKHSLAKKSPLPSSLTERMNERETHMMIEPILYKMARRPENEDMQDNT